MIDIEERTRMNEVAWLVGWVGWIQDLGFRHSHIILTQSRAGAILYYRLAKHSETFQ